MMYRRIKGTEYKKLQAAMCKTDCVCMYSYFIALITHLLLNSFVILKYSVCGSESPMETAWYLIDECTVISANMIDSKTAI